MGARVLLYYTSSEGQWINRTQLSCENTTREISWQDYSAHISSQFYGQNYSNLYEWQLVLWNLYSHIDHPDFVPTFLSHNVRHMSIVPSSDFSASQYLYQYDKTVNRLDRYIKNASACKRPLLNLHGQIQMEYPPPSFTISPMCLPYHWWVVHWLCNIWGNTIDYLTAPISNLYPHSRLWRGFSKTMDCPWWKTYRLIFNIAEYPDNGLPSIPQPWPHIPIFVHVHARISGTRTPHSIVWNTIRPF